MSIEVIWILILLTVALTAAIILYVMVWIENARLLIENARLREALGRFANVSLVRPVDLEQYGWDVLNARKALKGDTDE